MDTEEATLLLDLDADLLLFVIEASGASGQGVCKGVCKLLALLVEEVEKTTPFFASASIEGDEDFATTAMCANADISYPRPVAHALPLTCRVPVEQGMHRVRARGHANHGHAPQHEPKALR